jgi:hypothetical protein
MNPGLTLCRGDALYICPKIDESWRKRRVSAQYKYVVAVDQRELALHCQQSLRTPITHTWTLMSRKIAKEINRYTDLLVQRLDLGRMGCERMKIP